MEHYAELHLEETILTQAIPEKIADEDEAIAILSGMQLETFKRLQSRKFYLYKMFKESEDFSDDDPSSFQNFVEEFSDENDENFLLIVKKIKKCKLWHGDLKEYAQALYDKGFTFSDEAYVRIGMEKIDYTNGGEIHKVYQYWCKRAGWTFNEAFSLFIGQSPQENLIDNIVDIWLPQININYIKRIKFYSWIDSDLILYNENGIKVNLSSELRLSISVQDIASYNHKHEGKAKVIFKPKEIVKWLLKFTNFFPPYPLIHYLFEEDEDERKRYQDQRKAKLEKLEQTKQNMPKMSYVKVRLQRPTTLYAEIVYEITEANSEINSSNFYKKLEQACVCDEWKKMHNLLKFNRDKKFIIWQDGKEHDENQIKKNLNPFINKKRVVRKNMSNGEIYVEKLLES